MDFPSASNQWIISNNMVHKLKIPQELKTTEINKRIVYFADPMLSIVSDTIEDEFESMVAMPLRTEGLSFKEGTVKYTDTPPFDDRWDIFFFDYGGMMLGNSLMEHFCRQIINQAPERSNTLYVMVSLFTKQAMNEAFIAFGEDDKPFNILLSIKEFAEYYKKYELGV